MNEKLFHLINDFAGRSHFLDVAGVFFAEKFLYVFAVIIALLWLDKRVRNYVYLAFASAFVSRIIIVEVLKRIVNHARPYEILTHIHQLLADSEHGMSFPSGHTVVYFSFAFAFWKTPYFWPFLILATLGSVARIFVGVHFPADIAASIAIAWIVVWLCRKYFKGKPDKI